MPARRSGPGTEDLRSLALRVGMTLLEQSGPDNLSLREVAREAGVTAMGLAHHFGDRNGLLEAMAREGWQNLCERFAPIPAGAQRAALASLMDFAQARPGLLGLMRSPDLAPHLDGTISQCLGHWFRVCGGAAATKADLVISWSWALGLVDVVTARMAPSACLGPELVAGLLDRMAEALIDAAEQHRSI
jgi:AcrR family transcriptional regulator